MPTCPDGQDAADFERAVAASRGNYSHAIRIVCDLLPLLGEDEVRAHACWHRDLARLAAGRITSLQQQPLAACILQIIGACTQHSSTDRATNAFAVARCR